MKNCSNESVDRGLLGGFLNRQLEVYANGPPASGRWVYGPPRLVEVRASWPRHLVIKK